jgi:hypothetical protein
VTRARDAATANPDRGFGARWLAMNSYTLDSAGATVLRALLAGLFIALFLFPLLLRLSRAKTTEDRRSAARAVAERADLDADTAIAVKKAEVRAALETMKAEQELSSARLALEAQQEIEREEQRRRVAAAIEAPVQVSSERVVEPVAELTAEVIDEPKNLPALAEPDGEKRGLIPMPDIAKAATRWIRPFVPPIVASAIDTTTRPLRSAREVFEETEEIHFGLRRSHRVSVTSEETTEVEERAEQLIDATPKASVKRAKLGTGGGRRELPSADR